jgi:hypothetical protein
MVVQLLVQFYHKKLVPPTLEVYRALKFTLAYEI